MKARSTMVMSLGAHTPGSGPGADVPPAPSRSRKAGRAHAAACCATLIWRIAKSVLSRHALSTARYATYATLLFVLRITSSARYAGQMHVLSTAEPAARAIERCAAIALKRRDLSRAR